MRVRVRVRVRACMRMRVRVRVRAFLMHLSAPSLCALVTARAAEPDGACIALQPQHKAIIRGPTGSPRSAHSGVCLNNKGGRKR